MLSCELRQEQAMGHFGVGSCCPYSGQCQQHCQPSLFSQTGWTTAAWSPWALPLAQFAGWPLQPAVHSRARLQGWPAASGARLSCSAWGFGWDAADPFTSTGYQLFMAASSGHSDPKLQGSLGGRRKISQQLLLRGMVTQQDHDWSLLAFPGC